MRSLFLATMMTVATASVGKTVTVSPADDLQAVLEHARGGDTVMLEEGVYPPITLTRRFSAEASLRIMAQNPEDRVVIQGEGPTEPGHALELRESSFVVFENLWFRSAFRGVWIEDSHHVVFLGCEVSETGQEGFHILLRSHHVDIIDCVIHHTGRSPEGSQWGEGIYIGRGSGHDADNIPVIVHGNRIERTDVPREFNGLAVLRDPGTNPNQPQRWHRSNAE